MHNYEPDPRVAGFISRLDKLDAGDRARLKRCAGQTLAEARQVGLFYSLLPAGVSEYHEQTYFLVATLYPLAEGNADGDLGISLHRARTDKNAKGLDRRVQFLLDADETQLPFRLRQAIHFLQSNRERVNWLRLLDDLLRWNLPSRTVQRRWARSYFGQ